MRILQTGSIFTAILFLGMTFFSFISPELLKFHFIEGFLRIFCCHITAINKNFSIKGNKSFRWDEPTVQSHPLRKQLYKINFQV